MSNNSNNIRWNLDEPWCIGIEDYKTLKKYINHDSNANTIVELGSGKSTFQLANDFSHSTILSLEDNPIIKEQNNQYLNSNGLHSANILLAPIKISTFQGGAFITYDFSILESISEIDLLIVDGPVERLFPMGRESSLYFLFDKLAIGGIIALDDYHRTSAKLAVSNWLSVFGNSLSLEEETDSFAILRKKSECFKPKMGIRLALTSYKALAKSLFVNIKRSISLRFRPENKVKQ